jgi:hypothetical protein
MSLATWINTNIVPALAKAIVAEAVPEFAALETTLSNAVTRQLQAQGAQLQADVTGLPGSIEAALPAIIEAAIKSAFPFLP